MARGTSDGNRSRRPLPREAPVTYFRERWAAPRDPSGR
jgi:hypothetical protein